MATNNSNKPRAIDAVRLATADLHRAAEQVMPLGNSIDPGSYLAHLRALLRWLHPLQTWLHGYSDGPQDPYLLIPLDRVLLLERDITGLMTPGHPPTGGGFALERSAPIDTAESSAAFRWGVCYVIEGAQLGGTVLAKKLAAHHGNLPLEYFNGEGASQGARWRLFVDTLNQEVKDCADIAAASRGACFAFERLLITAS